MAADNVEVKDYLYSGSHHAMKHAVGKNFDLICLDDRNVSCQIAHTSR
jgi:hypothetical protein